MKLITTSAIALMLACSAGVSGAETLRWARAGDALTLDPHSQNEGPTHTVRHQIYEPLLMRDASGEFEAALATDWRPSATDPNVWVFELREEVTFHDGSEFTAEDVVFSLNRAKQPTSDMKELVGTIVDVRAVGDHMVEIETDGPNPLLPNNLTNLMIMDKGWAEANATVQVQDFEGGEITFATTNANGTGAYKLVSREPDVRTVMSRNDSYWGVGVFPMEVTEIIYTPIQNPATRLAALLSGEVDFLQEIPVQDLGRIRDTAEISVKETPQNRVVFFGLNTAADDLETDNIDGRNPLADVRVRRAISLALDREAIRQVIMRGQSQPAGMIAPPFVNGWNEEMEAEGVRTDVEQAKALMSEAGYPDGFSIRLDCPNDRYINDEGICQASVGMLAQIGIKVSLDAKPKAQHFPLVTDGLTDFYMLGWGVPTFDSEYIFNYLVHGRTSELGTWNNTGFDRIDINDQISALSSNTDLDARDSEINAIWQVVQDEQIYVPIHHQILNWALRDTFDVEIDAENQPKIKRFSVN